VINTVGFTSWRDEWSETCGLCIERTARRKVNVKWNEIALFCRGGEKIRMTSPWVIVVFSHKLIISLVAAKKN